MCLAVLGWGNDSHGDDGLGPTLLARFTKAGWPNVNIVADSLGVPPLQTVHMKVCGRLDEPSAPRFPCRPLSRLSAHLWGCAPIG